MPVNLVYYAITQMVKRKKRKLLPKSPQVGIMFIFIEKLVLVMPNIGYDFGDGLHALYFEASFYVLQSKSYAGTISNKLEHC